MPDQQTHLTETILTIQHEVQLALDYIETVANNEASTLGSSPSLLTVDNLRVKIPLVMQIEREEHPVTTEKVMTPGGFNITPGELPELKQHLLSREGLLLKVKEGSIGSFAKIRVLSPSPAPTETPPDTGTATPARPITGEIELSFIRMPRELGGGESQPSTPVAPGTSGTPVPNVVGLTLEQATTQLRIQGWHSRARAATAAEAASAPTGSTGKVLRQEPPSGQIVDKDTGEIKFWVSLSTLPVTEIEGIGETLAGRLAEAGLRTVGELSLARASEVASVLRVSESRARGFIDMAILISRLTIIGLPEQVVELLVRGAGIRSVEQLAEADPEKLYKLCRESVGSRTVRVPRGFLFTVETVAGWIKAARSYLNESPD